MRAKNGMNKCLQVRKNSPPQLRREKPSFFRKAWIRYVLLVVVLFIQIPNLYSYSVLTHEAVVDSLWTSSIEPLLRERFPRISDQELRSAHGYAYGGSIIQDMGYYPFGSKFFTDLVHYVRSGDFVVAMLRDSRNASEYAFA